MNRERGIGLLAWALVPLVIAAYLGPFLETTMAAPPSLRGWMALPLSFLLPGHPHGAHLATLALSLGLAALGMAFFWRSCGGSLWASGVAALALVASPYTVSSLAVPVLLPPPFTLFALGALVAALRRLRAGLATGPFWWLLALFLILQAAWGLFGLQVAVLGVAVIKGAWFLHRISRRRDGWRMVRVVSRQAILPFLATVVGVFLIWRQAPEGYWDQAGLGMPVSLPGLAALGLFAVGWWRRGYLPFQRRRFGRSFIFLGILGVAMGPLEYGRFSFLLTLAVCWWAAVGMEQLVAKYKEGPVGWLATLGPLLVITLLALTRA